VSLGVEGIEFGEAVLYRRWSFELDVATSCLVEKRTEVIIIWILCIGFWKKSGVLLERVMDHVFAIRTGLERVYESRE